MKCEVVKIIFKMVSKQISYLQMQPCTCFVGYRCASSGQYRWIIWKASFSITMIFTMLNDHDCSDKIRRCQPQMHGQPICNELYCLHAAAMCLLVIRLLNGNGSNKHIFC